MKTYGITKYDTEGPHNKLLSVAMHFKPDFPEIQNPPTLKFIMKVIELLQNAEIGNVNTYNDFRTKMSKYFKDYDDAAFRESLTKFGTFKSRGSDNKGRLRKSEIDLILNKLNNCGYSNNTDKPTTTFKELINSMTSHNLRLYVPREQSGTYLQFNKDACSFMRNFKGNQSNFGKETEGFSSFFNYFKSSPEPFTNAYSIAKTFGIDNPVKAVQTVDGSFMTEPDFYSKINSFGVNTVAKYDEMVKVYTKFGSDKTNFCKVVEHLKKIGVPQKDYVVFVKAMSDKGITYPYFEQFITTIVDFGVVYSNYYKFMDALNAFGVTFTPPIENTNTMYRFLNMMKANGMGISYRGSAYPCGNAEQPQDAFFTAMKTFIAMGFTINSFFATDPQDLTAKVSVMDLINLIKPYDCRLRDFTTSNVYELNTKNDSIFKAAVNAQTRTIADFTKILVGRVKDKTACFPNLIFSFMTDDKFNSHMQHNRLNASVYRNISQTMDKYINSNFMKSADTVKDDRIAEHDTINLHMNTLRIFPHFTSGFIFDTVTNKNNAYFPIYFSEKQDENPKKQRGCTSHFMKVESDITQCPGYTAQK